MVVKAKTEEQTNGATAPTILDRVSATLTEEEANELVDRNNEVIKLAAAHLTATRAFSGFKRSLEEKYGIPFPDSAGFGYNRQTGVLTVESKDQVHSHTTE